MLKMEKNYLGINYDPDLQCKPGVVVVLLCPRTCFPKVFNKLGSNAANFGQLEAYLIVWK